MRKVGNFLLTTINIVRYAKKYAGLIVVIVSCGAIVIDALSKCQDELKEYHRKNFGSDGSDKSEG